jgi:hypothetical protein
LIDPRVAGPIKAMVEKELSFGYRSVAWLQGFNKDRAQRVFQIKGWQVHIAPLYRVGSRLWSETGVHHAAQPLA